MSLPTMIDQHTASDESSEKFFTCLVEAVHVTMAIWTIVDNAPKVLKTGTPKEWQDGSSLVDAVELGLEEFHQNAEGIEKILFSLPERWMNQEDIKGEYKQILKKMTEKLTLKPIGFVLTSEALFEYHAKFKSVVKSLYFEWNSNDVLVYLIHQGKIEQKEVVGRSTNIADDVTEALARFGEQQLPTQLYFFSFELSTDQLEHEKQQFLGHNWDESKIFHHLPSIDVMTRDQLIEAVCLSGGKETLPQAPAASIDSEYGNEVTEVRKEDLPVLNTAPVVVKVPDEHVETAIDTEQKVVVKPSLGEKMFSFGVPIPSAMVKREDTHFANNPDAVEDPELAVDESVISAVPSSKKRFAFSLPRFGMPSIKGGGGKRGKLKTLGFLAGAVVLIGSIGGYFYLASTATVEVDILLKTEAVSIDTVVILDPEIEETDPAEQILKVDIESKEVSSSEETSTTGSKVIGEKAKGKVLILNKTTNLKTFAKGTEIKSGDKAFELESDVTVASASTKESGDTQTTEFGKESVVAIAKDIGADFNLDKDADFSVANFGKDTYSARSEEDLKGGSSREIQAVSLEDIAKLRASLKKSLIEQAEKELKESAGEGRYIVLTGKSSVKSEEPSAKLGDETHTLKMTMTVVVEAYEYESDDLKPIAKTQLASLVPEGGVLLEDEVSILSKEGETASKSAALTLDATLSSKYVPPTDSDAWLNEISGKTVEQAKSILNEKDEIESVEVKISPRIAGIIIGKIPKDQNKIQLKKRTQ